MEVATHQSRVWQVTVHPRLPSYATVSGDRTAQIRCTETHALLKELKDVHERSVRSAAWRSYQPMLALGSFDATISIFALEEPNWEFLAQLEGHDNEIKGVAWSTDGNFLASCSRDKSVWIWEVDDAGEDFECIAVLQEHTQDVKHVAWHPHEEILASASYDDSVRLWRRDDDEWLCVAILSGPDGHDSTVWSCDFDPNNMRSASASSDLKVKIWSKVSQSGGSGEDSSERLPSVARWDVLSEEWHSECELPSIHTYTIYAVKWHKKNKIVSAGADGRIVIYTYDTNTAGWNIEHTIEYAHGVFEINTVDWIDENTIISGGDDGSVKVWNSLKLNRS